MEDQIEALKSLIQSGLSRLAKTPDATGYALCELNIEEKGITNLYKLLDKYPYLRYINISKNELNDLDAFTSISHLLVLNACKNQIS